MILIDTIEQPTTYDYVCIGALGCEPVWADDTHTNACHRQNDVERRDFYADHADDVARRFILAGEAAPMFGEVADRLTVERGRAALLGQH